MNTEQTTLMWTSLSVIAGIVALVIAFYLGALLWGLILAPLAVGFLTFTIFIMRMGGTWR